MEILKIVTGCKEPVKVIVAVSVDHTFHKGDLMIFTNHPEEPFRVGETISFWDKAQNFSIVRKVIDLEKWVEVLKAWDGINKVCRRLNGTWMFLIQYNNSMDNQASNEPFRLWMKEEDMDGRLRLTLPYAGILPFLVHEYRYFRYAMYGILCILILLFLLIVFRVASRRHKDHQHHSVGKTRQDSIELVWW